MVDEVTSREIIEGFSPEIPEVVQSIALKIRNHSDKASVALVGGAVVDLLTDYIQDHFSELLHLPTPGSPKDWD